MNVDQQKAYMHSHTQCTLAHTHYPQSRTLRLVLSLIFTYSPGVFYSPSSVSLCPSLVFSHIFITMAIKCSLVCFVFELNPLYANVFFKRHSPSSFIQSLCIKNGVRFSVVLCVCLCVSPVNAIDASALVSLFLWHSRSPFIVALVRAILACIPKKLKRGNRIKCLYIIYCELALRWDCGTEPESYSIIFISI